MTSKKWLIAFFATILLIGAGVVGLNYLADPFGVFTGPGLQWPSYEMTTNPRTAKISYLEQDDRWQNYDSYIIGCSSTSSYPTEQLNEYYDASFYNMIMYGADMRDVEQLSRYLVENYTVKNLVVSVYIDHSLYYDTLSHPLSFELPPEVSGKSPLAYYAKYLFADPRYAADKLSAAAEDTLLPQKFDVFNPETGTYDKRVRDVEFFGTLDDYLAAYPAFADYPDAELRTDEAAVSGTLNSLTAIRDLCAERGINFQIVCPPVYWEYLAFFDQAQLREFYTRLAQVAPYWDFTYSSVSFEPRYFYDETHFRNCVGKMALARMFGDDSVYVPADFGAYVTLDTVEAHLDRMLASQAVDLSDYTADVPVLMYHALAEDAGDLGETYVSAAVFERQMAALRNAGYTAVTIDQLIDYVYAGTELPEKPVLITFDDGYTSNYELAYPILERYGMKGVIFVIGCSVGHTEFYKDTEFPITPHFSYEQAREMMESGVIDIQTHTYDMHQWAPYETGDQVRGSMLPLEGESDEDYAAAIVKDLETAQAEMEAGTGARFTALAYPNGQYTTLSEVTLHQHGIQVTLTTTPGQNTLVKGIPQTLYGLRRYAVSDSVTPEQLLELLGE